MTMRLSDIIDVTVFNDLPAVNSPEKTAFFESGVVTRNALLDNMASQPGKTAELPFWRDLDETTAPNLSTDNPASDATPQGVTQGEQIARKAFLNQGWAAADLASEVAMGQRAMEHIRGRVDRYWMRQWQRRLIASVNGILADNVANDSSDMVEDIAVDSSTTSSVFTRENFTSAAFTLGDAYDGLTALAVHSIVYKRMIDNDDVDFIPDSQGNLTIPTFLGQRVIVDDSLPVDPNGANDPKYTSVLFGSMAMGYGEGTPDTPTAIERAEKAADGGGVESLWSRKTWVLHPFGFKTASAPAATSQTLTELAEAASWDRVVDRKNVPMAFLVTN